MASYIVTDRIRVNIIHSFAVPPRVKCEQYDGDYTKLIQATVYNGDVLYSIPSAVRRIVVSGLKPDGNGFSYDCTWNGNTVSFSLMRQMTAVDGKVPCNITMFDALNNQVSSAVFVLDVEKAALPSDVVVSSNDFQTFIGYVQAANLYWQYSKSFAVGNTGVREGENVDNAKYYAHLARMYKGSPLTASTISEMEDTERVYVYVGNESGYNNGHWYFYDDTAWVDGGVYNSQGQQTDTELITPGIAADAKAVGDIIGHETLETEEGTLIGTTNALNDISKFDISLEKATFLFGNIDDEYGNGVAFDGTYFYESYHVYGSSDAKKIIKMDKNGVVIASVSTNESINDITYFDGYIYVGALNKIIKYDSNLANESYVIADLGESTIAGIAHDDIEDKFYLKMKDRTIRIYDNEFEFIDDYVLPNVGISGDQGIAVYNGYVFILENYPNTLYVVKNGKIIDSLVINGVIAKTKIGEIQSIATWVDSNNRPHFYTISAVSFTDGVIYYTPLFCLNPLFDFEMSSGIPYKQGEYDLVMYVDSTSLEPSKGTQEQPFHSLTEALCHGYPEKYMRIDVINAHETYDKPASTREFRRYNVSLRYYGIVPNSRMRFEQSILSILLYDTISESIEISVASACDVAVAPQEGFSQDVILTNRSSRIVYNGDLAINYNVSGLTIVNGIIDYDQSPTDGGVTRAYGVNRKTTNSPTTVQKGMQIIDSVTFNTSGAKRVKLTTDGATNGGLCGIISFLVSGSARLNRAYYVQAYGSGGTDRSFIGLIPAFADDGGITPTILTNETGFQFDFTAPNSSYGRITYTSLGYTGSTNVDSAKYKLSIEDVV